MVSDVVIVAAKRTPIGSFNGCLSTVAAHDLASGLIKVNLESRGERGTNVDLTGSGVEYWGGGWRCD